MVTILSGFVTMPLLSCGSGLDLVDDVHSRDDLAEGGIFAIEEAGVGGGDEKLRIGRIRILRTRHADDAPGEMGRLNSAGRLGRVEPPVPVPVGSPVCAMNPGMTRWNTMPS